MIIMISLDLKKNRIRIHKQTLKLLGNPEYVHFMVNPSLGNIAVAPCSDEVSDALKITYGTGVDCELYSKTLTGLLAMLNPDLDLGKTYRLSGEANESDRLAVFSIRDITPVNPFFQKERSNKNERSHLPGDKDSSTI